MSSSNPKLVNKSSSKYQIATTSLLLNALYLATCSGLVKPSRLGRLP